MSSMRNSLHRRQHKERSQLANRAKLGFLEKHKDYVLRARDYHSKQDRLQRLRQKAADRNKDEFYWGMIRGQTKEGVHIQDRGNVALPLDIVKVLKTQDENYLRTMRAAGLKKIDKLKTQLTMLADLVKPESFSEDETQILVEAGVIPAPTSSKARKNKTGKSRSNPTHVVFVENEVEAKKYASDSRRPRSKEGEASSSTQVKAQDPVDLGWKESKEKKERRRKSNKLDVVDVEMGEVDAQETKEAASKHRGRLLKELSARLARDRMLRYAERELEMQRLLMAKGGRKKLQGVEKVEGDGDEEDEDDEKPKRAVDEAAYKPRVYKWRLERKR
ncbi:hypothetical protein JAAARDRAFT_188910 [Jaapia argillacea MUCL 33604]|uniref:U3 small nucleolar RNA-associated protein 11 n=1 Tax=Jaapia argillacea MUCL 33604 TaxID=933084 RepID=A0A067QIH3_9AGAM|nr:hypothetical protein JAAARDRAFT_188910 [Jaapia argillacea MUCL 33604]